MAANTQRGEVTFTYKGKAMVLRPTYEAMAAIESELGALVPLSLKLVTRNFGLREVVVILTEGLKAGSEAQANVAAVGAMVVDLGLVNEDLLKTVNDFLQQALTGGREIKPAPKGHDAGKAQAAEAK